jgi:hypothetical protein
MSWSLEQQRRLAFEKKLIEREMGNFRFYNPTGNTYIEGWAKSNSGCRYKGRIELPPGYPYCEPDLYIVSPRTLFCHGSGTINEVGTTHRFHTIANGRGYVQICHTGAWDSSKTCWLVLLKLYCWIEAYEAHLKTGQDIADYLR